MEIRLRRVGREDGNGEMFDRLLALDQSCFRAGIAWSRRELLGFLFHPRAVSLIAENRGGLAGFAIVEMEGDAGHIATIDVDRRCRRMGVGRALIDGITVECRRADADRLCLEAAVDNEGALGFYRALGFRETGRIRNFYLGKLDALTMEKKITAP